MNDPKDIKSLNPANPAEALGAQSVETPRSINFLLDIPLELTVEVGRRAMTMGELIDLMPGTVVELDRPAGGQLDIMANGKLIAKGEAVVVGDRYGVRILEIIGDDPFNSNMSEIPGSIL